MRKCDYASVGTEVMNKERRDERVCQYWRERGRNGERGRRRNNEEEKGKSRSQEMKSKAERVRLIRDPVRIDG